MKRTDHVLKRSRMRIPPLWADAGVGGHLAQSAPPHHTDQHHLRKSPWPPHTTRILHPYFPSGYTARYVGV